eukprot:365161-Chlamydomonas_euryale.AAC.9
MVARRPSSAPSLPAPPAPPCDTFVGDRQRSSHRPPSSSATPGKEEIRSQPGCADPGAAPRRAAPTRLPCPPYYCSAVHLPFARRAAALPRCARRRALSVGPPSLPFKGGLNPPLVDSICRPLSTLPQPQRAPSHPRPPACLPVAARTAATARAARRT